MSERMLYQVQDDLGRIEVVQQGAIRALTFGNNIRQSALNLQRPQEPVFDYLKKMLLSLALVPHAERVLLLGLGGGSLAYTLRHFRPDLTLTAVEYRSTLILIAQEYFGLADQKIDFRHQTAQAYLADRPGKFDIIFTDLFSATGMAPCLQDPHFIAQASQSLNPKGVHCLNLWSSQPYHYQQVKSVLEAEHPQMLYEQDRLTTNVVAFALHPSQPPSPQGFAQRVKQLEKDWGFRLEGR